MERKSKRRDLRNSAFTRYRSSVFNLNPQVQTADLSYSLNVTNLPSWGAAVLRPYMNLRYYQVQEFVGHYNLFYYALAVDVLGYGWDGQGLGYQVGLG
jgi:hypothetical protein